jgi:hypothetical protein
MERGITCNIAEHYGERYCDSCTNYKVIYLEGLCSVYKCWDDSLAVFNFNPFV